MGTPAIITDPDYQDDVIRHAPNPTVQGIPIPGVPEAAARPAIPLGAPAGQHPAIAPESPLHVKSGIAGLWDKESNIHNPVLRTAAKTGTGILGALESVGNIVAPGVTSAIPGTRNNKLAAIRTDEANEASAAHTGLENAQAKEAGARADALSNPPQKDREEWEQVKGFAGPNGEPLEREKTSGTYRLAQLPQGVQPTEGPVKDAFELWQKENPKGTFSDWQKSQAGNKPEDDKQKDISDYLQAHNLQDTAPNRETARTAIAQRGKTGGTGDARADRSYALQSGRLDKLRTPVDQIAQRLSRLTDTLSQNDPQADALVAPELLSVMAGGVGSGVRMNQAEIERIVGGRSAWENLKANLQHWSTDPEAARSITPEQDKQIRSLVQTVQQKISAKQALIQQAEEKLIDTDDPKEHRRIVADTQKQLDSIDAGTTNEQPQGKVLKYNAQTGKLE